jgi:hypothetical protein
MVLDYCAFGALRDELDQLQLALVISEYPTSRLQIWRHGRRCGWPSTFEIDSASRKRHHDAQHAETLSDDGRSPHTHVLSRLTPTIIGCRSSARDEGAAVSRRALGRRGVVVLWRKWLERLTMVGCSAMPWAWQPS